MEIVLTEIAIEQMREIADRYASESSDMAAKWFNGLLDAIEGIAIHPESFPLARESEILRIEFRQMLYGVGKRKTHRILFVVHPKQIVVHGIRHGSQNDIELF